MQTLSLNKIKKFYGDRLILDIDNLELYEGDKVGIVGINGSGKTTLLNIISGRELADEGTFNTHGKLSYITQLDSVHDDSCEHMLSRFTNKREYCETMSGGEKTRLKLATGLGKNASLVLMDEPTTNLDIKGIQLLEDELTKLTGTLLLVSHDRELLDKICNKVLEVKNGNVKLYNGNYSNYKYQKQLEEDYAAFEYESYVREKERLTKAMQEKAEKSSTMRKTPKRMGNSEARLHKMGNQKSKKNLDNAVKSIKTRLDQLEVKEKPRELKKTLVDINKKDEIHSKILIQGNNINKAFGSNVIFNNAEFNIPNKSKTVLVGDNGCGKSTLVKMIVQGEDCIKSSSKLKIGYFSQSLDILDESKTILENVMESSPHGESFTRTVLSRLLFTRDEVYKKVEVLSGGERVKVTFAKIFLQDINILILDEPTNFLDMATIEAIENALEDYQGTILAVSHDRRFLSSVASRVLHIGDKKINTYEGCYEEFIKSNQRTFVNDSYEDKILLENKIAQVIGQLSDPTLASDKKNELDREFMELTKKLRSTKL
ncbi:ABC-F type ribosomal protection protein [Alkalicella caledoniensis]|uniref:ABC-F type ribosomal protection protein n=1 Tax=Alkalicella caledoniensis TaxID=2731377 RepID=A0A7G9W9V1_ALKCA|nr:ABC-F type ribosomal protection protein [Alkalicella caledoniensis]QNO15463.1 ABC-F type ribosomal protection protein [Alkalicella caledoniensis]